LTKQNATAAALYHIYSKLKAYDAREVFFNEALIHKSIFYYNDKDDKDIEKRNIEILKSIVLRKHSVCGSLYCFHFD
jgi:hypothetical protein